MMVVKICIIIFGREKLSEYKVLNLKEKGKNEHNLHK